MNTALRKPSRWLLLLAVLALFAVACGGGPEEEEPAAVDTDEAAEPADTATEEMTDEATATETDAGAAAAEGGTVVFGADQEPDIMNPHLPEGNLFANGLIATAILESAYEVTADLEYVPELLDGEAEVTEDPFTVTYNILPDATWSDGTPVSSEDFAFHYEIFADPAVNVTSRAGYELIEDYEIVDEKTITFTFSQIFAPYRTLFSNLLPAHALEGGEAFNSAMTDGIPVSSGPLVFDSWDRGTQINLRRNENYWGGDVAIEQVVVRFLPDSNTQVQALAGGEIDMFYPQPQLELVEQVEAIEGVTSQTAAALSWEHMDFNQEVAPLDQQYVRRAIGMGIDRATLVEQLIAPLQADAVPLNNVIWLTNSEFYEDHWSEHIAYDPEAAIALLEENGCTRGDDDIFVCEGERLEFDYTTTAGNELRELSFQVIQQMLLEIGVQLNAAFGDAATVFADQLTTQNYEIFTFAWVGSPDPFGGNTIWICQEKDDEGNIVGLNYTGYCSPEVDELMARTNNIIDREERAEVYNQADALIAADVPLIPLYQRPAFMAWNERIQGPEINPTQWGPFWNIEDWSISE